MEYINNNFVKNDSLIWEDVDSGISRKIMSYDDNLMLVYVKFQKGAVGKLHSHPHSQMSSIHSGKFEVTIGLEKTILSDDDVFYAPPNVEHGTLCLEEGIIIDVFSPVRKDFLEGKSGYKG